MPKHNENRTDYHLWQKILKLKMFHVKQFRLKNNDEIKMFHVKHFIKTVWNRKKCSDIAELLGNHQKMQNHRWKNSKKPLNSVKTEKNHCKTVLFKMFHVKHRQKSPIF